MDNESQKARTTSIAVVAIVAVVALLGVVAITIVVTIPLQQEAEARGCERGAAAGTAINASKGRCFGH
jgi:hypothetical protein